MKVLLLGVGMQGKVALSDLAASDVVSEVIAADRDLEMLKNQVTKMGYGNVVCEHVDARDPGSIDRLMGAGVKVAIDLLPPQHAPVVARSALKAGVHLVNTFYVSPERAALADEATARGVTVLPGFGLDPGIDLVMLGEAFRRLDSVREVRTYGAGIPEAAAADNPLKYKVSWIFDGVLNAYRTPARLIQDGEVLEVGDTELFDPEHVHHIDVEGLGRLEAFPNEDALAYREFLNDPSALTHMGRYTCRWPGHCAFWKKLVDLHFLDETAITIDERPVSPRRFLAALLEPQLQYKEGERDVAFVRVDVRGLKEDRPQRLVFELIDRKDLQTGFTAMSRTVGFTASIGAQMILDGTVAKAGLLSPVRDVPWQPFKQALDRRGVRISLQTQP